MQETFLGSREKEASRRYICTCTGIRIQEGAKRDFPKFREGGLQCLVSGGLLLCLCKCLSLVMTILGGKAIFRGGKINCPPIHLTAVK